MTSAAEPGDRRGDIDVKAIVIGQVLVVLAFLACWWVTGFDDTPGRDLVDHATIVGITLSIPAFLSGVVAGGIVRKSPRTRRILMIAFAVVACAAAWFLYDKGPAHCDNRVLPINSRCAGSPSWKDAVGAFLGAEFAIAFQAGFAWLSAGLARKYPLRRPAP